MTPSRHSDERRQARRSSDAEALAVFLWCQADDPAEDLPERARVRVADVPGDPFDGCLRELQQLTRLSDPKALDVLAGRQPRCLLETPDQRSLLKPGLGSRESVRFDLLCLSVA